MFIKWREENRPLTPEQEAKIAHLHPAWASSKKRNPATHRFYAYLAKSSRVEGKPRQKVIAYLGSIPACAMQGDTGDEWRFFWYKVHCALSLRGASNTTYHTVLDEVSRRVACPSQEELARIAYDEFERYPHWKKDYETLRRALEWSNRYFDN